MKRGFVLAVILLITLPLVHAAPAFPNAIPSEDGSWVPVVVNREGEPIRAFFEEDQEKFDNPDPDVGKKVFTQTGDHDYSEVYELETDCPIVFQKTEGRLKPFVASLSTDGYFQANTNIPFKPNLKKEEFEQQGAICGKENIQQIRPQRPQGQVRQIQNMYNQERQIANTEYGSGVKQQPDGSQSYYNPSLQQQQQQGELSPPQKNGPKPIIIFTGQVVYDINYETKELPMLVIPVQFTDVKASVSTSEIEDMFFGKESLTSYFEEQSYGALQLSGTVLPKWYTLSETMGYYGDDNEANVEEMIIEAIKAADADIDFSQYDANEDGIVDGLFVVHAGDPDENGGGNNEEIWSHYFSISPVTVDGVRIIDYETVSETSPVGIVAHEFGHYLGLPDLYDTTPDDGTSKGTAEWSIMGYGGYMDDPGSFDPWSKTYLSWLNENSYKEIESNDYFSIVEDSSTTGIRYYAVPISSTELFFIENRHKAEIMNGDEAGGILIWHIDESIIDETGSWNGCSGTKWDCNTVNGEAEHKLVDVEEADGTDNIDDGDLGEAEDLWFSSCSTFGGCQQNEFSSSSTPLSKSYDGTQSIYIGVYSDIGTEMELGVTIDGTTLAAPTEKETISTTTEEETSTDIINSANTESTAAPEEKSSSTMFIIIGISLVLIGGGIFLAFRLLNKKNSATA